MQCWKYLVSSSFPHSIIDVKSNYTGLVVAGAIRLPIWENYLFLTYRQTYVASALERAAVRVRAAATVRLNII